MDRSVLNELYMSNKELNARLNETKENIERKIEELRLNQNMIFNLLANVTKQNESIISMLRINNSDKQFINNMNEIDNNIKNFKKINKPKNTAIINSFDEELIKL